MSFLLIDNYDSFTFILAHYLENAGICPLEVVRNNDPALMKEDFQKYQGIVLSPGPGTPQESGYLMEIIETYIGKVPLFGVCLGFQAIGMHLGMELKKSKSPWHGVANPINHTHSGLFQNLPIPMLCGRYHSLYLVPSESDSKLIVTATDAQNIPMAFENKELKVWGVQFHPESCLTQGGEQLILNLKRAWGF